MLIIRRSPEELIKKQQTIVQKSKMFKDDESYEAFKAENEDILIVNVGRNREGQIHLQYEYIT
ncbi:hypothetical protein [Bacillus sp. CBEL-1]|uniref:hypothetical protein n=1 Tax=Bacillus sp. CBEL-1 TaxID=2502980 RepID=UPI001049781F|nr:hypothetical protein [Bacillus sp. CBEL-1]TDB51750.1 hypothetical protein EPL02_08355 [Bacillus sp. CBEL-1]